MEIVAAIQQAGVLMLDAIRHEPILSGLAVLVLFPFVRSFLLSRRITRLLKGGDGKSLEGTLTALHNRTLRLEKYAQQNTKDIQDIERRLVRSVQSISVERFDPFAGAGGQQSFATAFLNEKGDGVVVSGIHARDSIRVYAKKIAGFASDIELSEEEARAIQNAKKELAG